MRPIGISASLKPAPGENWFRGNRWPPENTEPPGATAAQPWAPNRIAAFTPRNSDGSVKMPPRAWGAYHYSVVLLTEFVQQPSWSGIDLSPYLPQNQTVLDAELNELAMLIEFRPGVMSEALVQRNNIPEYFSGVLAFTKSSHPSTYYLVQGAFRVAQFQAMFHKNRHQRPRPSQLSPGLMPPIEVPGHASFPSGHATEAHIISLCLAEVLAQAAALAPPFTIAPSLPEPLDRMAQRIARNREILGLHYPSDSVAGKNLAEQTFAILRNCPTIGALIAQAAAEWREYT
jgi:hypothetical protein